MIAKFEPFRLSGKTVAPPSKSVAHRYLIAGYLSGDCTVKNVSFSEDILATLDSLKALGAKITVKDDEVHITNNGIASDYLNCRESGSTLRFLIPIALTKNRKIVFSGAKKLFERPLGIYEEIASANGFLFEKNDNSLAVCGQLKSGKYNIRGNVSSQFITGLMFALSSLTEESVINVAPPFESRSYVLITLDVLKKFGIRAEMSENTITVFPSRYLSQKVVTVEGDYSNAAYIDAFNEIGSNIELDGLSDTLQGDAVYKEYFASLKDFCKLDLSDCPDLAPILFSLAAQKKGAVFTGTKRLAIKESNRAEAMRRELSKFGIKMKIFENEVTVEAGKIATPKEPLSSHNDHRIAMALALPLSIVGGELLGPEAVKKSFPDYFEKIKSLGAKVMLTEQGGSKCL